MTHSFPGGFVQAAGEVLLPKMVAELLRHHFSGALLKGVSYTNLQRDYVNAHHIVYILYMLHTVESR